MKRLKAIIERGTFDVPMLIAEVERVGDDHVWIERRWNGIWLIADDKPFLLKPELRSQASQVHEDRESLRQHFRTSNRKSQAAYNPKTWRAKLMAEYDAILHHPLHVVAQWTGHTVETMRKFYLQVTDEHRDAALAVKPELLPRLDEAKQKAKQSERDWSRQSDNSKDEDVVSSIRDSSGLDMAECQSSDERTRTADLSLMKTPL